MRGVYVYREHKLRSVRACAGCYRDAVRICFVRPLRITKAPGVKTSDWLKDRK